MNKLLTSPKFIFYGVLAIIAIILVMKGLKYIDTLKSENTRLHTELIGQTEKYQQLSEYSAKLEIKYKSQEDLKKEAEKKFSKELGVMEDKIKVLSDATFLIKEKARDTNNSDVVFNGQNSQFILNEVKFNDGPPVGYVLIFKDGRVVSKMYNHEIKVNMAVSKNEDTGRYVVVSKADYILKSPSLNSGTKSWLNVEYPLNIVGGTAQIDPTEPVLLTKKFHFWNPKLNANLNFDLQGMYPGLGLSIFSYGYTRNDLDFKFLEVGAQYKNSGFQPTLVPVLWRPFNGVLSNTYLGPGLFYDFPTNVGYFLGVQVGL